MSLIVETKKISRCQKYKFNIYSHVISIDELDDHILQIMFDENKLNQLFQSTSIDKFDRINQLRRFIETSFCNRENDIDDDEIRNAITGNSNNSYYSFFAEALLARLNIDYIDSRLVTAVISVDDTITTVSTGADVCMYSDDKLVIGEAKFYSELGGGIDNILNDTSFSSKLDSYINKLIKQKKGIILRNIDGTINKKTKAEINTLPLNFTGFVLHTKNVRGDYSTQYNKIDTLSIDNFPEHYQIHLYHLPIESKDELIFKSQRKALDLIIELQNA